MVKRRKHVAGELQVRVLFPATKVGIRHDCKREGLVNPASPIFMPVNRVEHGAFLSFTRAFCYVKRGECGG